MIGSDLPVRHMRATKPDAAIRQDANRTSSPPSPTLDDISPPYTQTDTESSFISSIPQMSIQALSEDNNIVLPSEPQPVKLEPLKTPDDGPEPRANLFDTLHGVIDPSLEIAPISPKIGQTLRLPSFHLLGIAARSPDFEILGAECSPAEVGAGSPIIADHNELVARSPSEACAKTIPLEPQSPPKSEPGNDRDDSKDIFSKPLHQHVDTITPPEESGSIDWSARVTVPVAGAESPADAPNVENAESTQATTASNGGLNLIQTTIGHVPTLIEPSPDMDLWLSRAIENLRELKSLAKTLASH